MRDPAEAERRLKDASAFGVFPTPVDDILEAAKVLVADEHLDEGLLFKIRRSAEKIGASIIKAISAKVWGVFDAIGRVIHISKATPPKKVPFLKMHEAGHAVLPWQDKIYAFEDCEKRLDPEIADLFDREANVFASEVLFQINAFSNEAADYDFNIKTPINLSKKYGASVYSSIRQYVTKHHYACAVLVLNMPQKHAELGYTASLRRHPDTSTEFQRMMGRIQWQTVFTPRDDIGALVPIDGRKMSGKRTLSLLNQDGDLIDCVAESFTNSYQVFILILIKNTVKKKPIIIPSLILPEITSSSDRPPASPVHGHSG